MRMRLGAGALVTACVLASEMDHNGISAEDVVMYEILGGEWQLAE